MTNVTDLDEYRHRRVCRCDDSAIEVVVVAGEPRAVCRTCGAILDSLYTGDTGRDTDEAHPLGDPTEGGDRE